MLLAATVIAPIGSAAHGTERPANVLLGRVTMPDGSPAAGADVSLTVMNPDEPETRHRVPALMTAKTAADGAFEMAVRLQPSMVEIALLNDRALNFELFAYLPQSSASQAVPPVTGTAYSAADLLYGTVLATGATDPADDVAGWALSMPDPVSLEMDAIGTVSASLDGTTTDHSCRPIYAPYQTIVGEQVPFEAVGELHTWWDMSAKFEYGRTANTDLGGAYSTGGGPYKVSGGTNHMGNTATVVWQDFPHHTGKVIRSQFRYQKRKLEYTDDHGDGRVCRVDYGITPKKWAGVGMTTGTDVSNKDGSAEFWTYHAKGWFGEWGPNSGWTKNKARGKKYTTDVSAFGVALHAQSSWSDKVDIHYRFGPSTAAPHWLFSRDGFLDKATVIYAY